MTVKRPYLRLFILIAAAATVAVAILAVSGSTGPTKSHGSEGYQTLFGTRYLRVSGSRIDNCGLCHLDFGGGGGFNPYGLAFQAQPTRDQTAFVNIEGLDSDGDGASNIDEINAFFEPGWDCDNIGSAANPPLGLANFVDQNNIGCVAPTPTATPTATAKPTPTPTQTSVATPTPAVTPTPAPSVATLSVSASANTAASGSSVVINATTKDGSGNPMGGVPVDFQIVAAPAGSDASIGSLKTTKTTTADGVAKATLQTGSVAGNIVVRVSVGERFTLIPIAVVSTLPQTGGPPAGGSVFPWWLILVLAAAGGGTGIAALAVVKVRR